MVDINASLGLFPVACIGNIVSSYPPAMFSGKIALSTVPLLLQLLVPSNSPESLTHLRACAGSAPNRRRDEPAASRGGGRAGQSGAGRREGGGRGSPAAPRARREAAAAASPAGLGLLLLEVASRRRDALEAEAAVGPRGGGRLRRAGESVRYYIYLII